MLICRRGGNPDGKHTWKSSLAISFNLTSGVVSHPFIFTRPQFEPTGVWAVWEMSVIDRSQFLIKGTDILDGGYFLGV